MKTYQDLVALGENEHDRINFVYSLINEHRASAKYKEADEAEQYDMHQNVTINRYQKFLYTVSGKAVPDNYSANYKLASNFFHIFVTQEVQHLLGNGVTWTNDMDDKLGKDFDNRLQSLAHKALLAGEAFGFYNLDHLEVFSYKQFAPLYDEDTGALMAGARFWQVEPERPLRATLYEIDGYTEYMWKNEEATILEPKQKYILSVNTTVEGSKEIVDGENYPTFPIVPLFANEYKQSALVGLREGIDCYDLIKSGFCNDLSDAAQIYWILQNAGGMGEVDLARFVERLKTTHAVNVDDGVSAEAHTTEVPFESREALLDRISKDLYRDAMALNVQDIVTGATTATQIRAAYELLTEKCDKFEFHVLDFLDKILFLAGIENEKPTFTRSLIINKLEEIQAVEASATNLSSEYVTRKILTILGDADKADDVIEEMQAEEINRFSIDTE